MDRSPLEALQEDTGDKQSMKIEGSIRSNLLSAISSARRWRGRPVHEDTVNHWRAVLEHGRRASSGQLIEPVAKLVEQLENELESVRVQ